MIPLSNLVANSPSLGRAAITHFNLFRSIELTQVQAEGSSSGEAIQTMERLAAEVLPPSMGYEWSGPPRWARVWRYCTDNFLGIASSFWFGCPTRITLTPLLFCWQFPMAILVGAVNARHTQRCLWSGWSSVMIGLASKKCDSNCGIYNCARKGLSITKAALEASARALATNSDDGLRRFWVLALVVGEGAGKHWVDNPLGTAILAVCFASTLPEFVYSASAVHRDWHRPAIACSDLVRIIWQELVPWRGENPFERRWIYVWTVLWADCHYPWIFVPVL